MLCAIPGDHAGKPCEVGANARGAGGEVVAGDDPSVLFKLFGVSSAGLVVIDVTASDILPGP